MVQMKFKIKGKRVKCFLYHETEIYRYIDENDIFEVEYNESKPDSILINKECFTVIGGITDKKIKNIYGDLIRFEKSI